MSRSNEKPLAGPALHDYFQTEISRCIEQLKRPVPPATQIYLAELLTRFAKSDRIFVPMEGQNELEPLTFILQRALDQEEDVERIRTLRHLGDIALFTSGFFSERIEQRGVEVDYYIEMGGMAYSNVATLSSRRVRGASFHELYEKLSAHFRDLVNLLWELADQTTMTSRDLLSIYQQWEQTKSRRLERKLLKNGFILAPGLLNCSS